MKVVNPGGVEVWKQGRGNVKALDDVVDHFEVTPRQILGALASAVDELELPHPVHVHGPNLGIPGNWETTLETMKALDGRRAHLAHIQFHSYGGAPGDLAHFDSRVPALADYVNAHPNLTVDVGQVMFGETTSMTADGAVGHYLHKLHGRKWLNLDVELETGCGVVPIEYKDTNFVHALQWAIGLEWYLRVDDPWRVAMSTDHPNGGSFLAYPEIIALLMDRGLRSETLAKLPDRVRAPLRPRRPDARIHPRRDRHRDPRRPGADARPGGQGPPRDRRRRRHHHLCTRRRQTQDVRIASLCPERWRHRHRRRRAARSARTAGPSTSAPGFDHEIIPDVAAWFSRDASIQFANFAVGEGDFSVALADPQGH